MIRSADLITCCSNALKKKIVNNFLISKYKIVVNPNPANLNNFYCDKNCLKENKLIYVGSLEERKGVCVLAKALNIVMKKYPNLKIEFIGKDTKRNSKNKSTKELIYEIVNKKYHQNLNFFGQIPNNEINKYLNTSLVAVFPSLFDNFPYVVLEAMSCGLHIVGSQNSGMVEMINDSNSLYKTGNVNNLALKIEEKYLLALKNNYNFDNIERVKKFYNSKNVCQNIIELYKNVITKYVDKNINKDDFQYLLKNIDRSDVIKFSKEKNGLANSVFKVTTRKKVYIVKKYNYNYDFNLANNLYDIYNINNINVVKPLNKKVIFYKNHYFNVFLYIKDEIPKNINLNFLSKFILINRKIDSENLLLKKCDFYYCNIKKDIKNIPYDHISYVLKEYENLSLVNTINNYLNHGDIQKSNIIKSNKKYYLIDFDETVVGPYLYDFAVIIIKFYSKRKLNWNKFNKLKKIIKIQNENLKDEDFYNIIKLYLCKILLEKFYYHSIGKINLLSKFQKKDNYIRYMKLLKSIGR